MNTQPPFVRNANLPGFPQIWTPVPPNMESYNIYTQQTGPYWSPFCDLQTAKDMLAACIPMAPDSVLVNILDPNATLPPGVGRYPVAILPSGQPGSISVYVIYGHVPLKDSGQPPAVLYEYAGYLADTKAGQYYQLEAEYANLTGSNTRAILYPYVSNWDTADSDCYWGDPLKGPVLPSLA